MNTTTAHPHSQRRQPTLTDLKPLRFRSEPSARHPLTAPTPFAMHDFLVFNPRPDLTGDLTGFRASQG